MAEVEARENQTANKEYRRGLREGVTRYAWWKDGVQYVGTCGYTLKSALAEIERDE